MNKFSTKLVAILTFLFFAYGHVIGVKSTTATDQKTGNKIYTTVYPLTAKNGLVRIHDYRHESLDCMRKKGI